MADQGFGTARADQVERSARGAAGRTDEAAGRTSSVVRAGSDAGAARPSGALTAESERLALEEGRAPVVVLDVPDGPARAFDLICTGGNCTCYEGATDYGGGLVWLVTRVEEPRAPLPGEPFCFWLYDNDDGSVPVRRLRGGVRQLDGGRADRRAGVAR